MPAPPQEAAADERWRAALDAMDRLHHRQSRELTAMHERQSAELGNLLRDLVNEPAAEGTKRSCEEGHQYALLETQLHRLKGGMSENVDGSDSEVRSAHDAAQEQGGLDEPEAPPEEEFNPYVFGERRDDGHRTAQPADAAAEGDHAHLDAEDAEMGVDIAISSIDEGDEETESEDVRSQESPQAPPSVHDEHDNGPPQAQASMAAPAASRQQPSSSSTEIGRSTGSVTQGPPASAAYCFTAEEVERAVHNPLSNRKIKQLREYRDDKVAALRSETDTEVIQQLEWSIWLFNRAINMELQARRQRPRAAGRQ